MIFESTDGVLSDVASMHVRGDKLEGYAFVPKILLKVVCTFVVKDMQIGGISVFFRIVNTCFKAFLLFPSLSMGECELS